MRPMQEVRALQHADGQEDVVRFVWRIRPLHDRRPPALRLAVRSRALLGVAGHAEPALLGGAIADGPLLWEADERERVSCGL